MGISVLIILLLLLLLSLKQDNMATFDLEKTNILKAILPLCIVAHHMSYMTVLSEFRTYGTVINSIFFALSGYGLSKNYTLKGEKYLKGFFQKRILKIIIPLLVVTLLYIILFGNIKDITNIIIALFSKGASPLPYSWFVYVLLYLYSSFYFAYKYVPEKFRLLLIFILTFIFICVTYKLGYNKIWFYSVGAFPIGLLYANYEKRIIFELQNRYVYFIVVLFFIMILRYLISLHLSFTDFVYFAIFPVVVFVLLSRVNTSKTNLTFVTFLSSISFELYLSQAMAMDVFRGEFFYVKSDWLYIFFVYVLLFFLAYVIHKFCSLVYKTIC